LRKWGSYECDRTSSFFDGETVNKTDIIIIIINNNTGEAAERG